MHYPSTLVVLVTAAGLAAVVALALSGGTSRADAYTFTVEYTNDGADISPGDGYCDSGILVGYQCSLRAAMQEANLHAGPDVIEFEIVGAGPHTIAVASPLPWITSPVTIDGFTQTGASANTNPLSAGSNAVMKIVVDGSGTSSSDGIALGGGATGSKIRGLVINNFDDYGVAIYGAAGSGNTVTGNYIGTNAAGTAIAANGAYGVNVTSPDNYIGGPLPAERNVISGNGGPGVYVAGMGGNIIEGNYIGTSATGAAALPNAGSGVTIVNSPANIVDGNLISGNDGGVRIDQAASTGNILTDNIIGLAADGDTPLGNAGGGVGITGAPANQIGEPGHGNVISGNDGAGVRITGATADQNVVQGNLIGTNANGDADRGNETQGITVYNVEKTQIGGSVPGEGNVISGNDGWGVFLDGGAVSPATLTTIGGNRIGTDITGTNDVGNGGGILLDEGTWGTTVGGEIGVTPGGACTGACNVISGNERYGVWMYGSTGNQVLNNAIGTAADGSSPLGNSSHGVFAEDFAFDNDLQGNTVAHNGDAGVAVDEISGRNKVVGGSVFSNGGLGIDLAPLGVTANDPGDGDGGANLGQNYPELTSAIVGATLSVTGRIDTTPSQYVTIQFYTGPACDPTGYGEGKTARGGFRAQTDGSGNLSFTREIGSPPPVGHFLTATAGDDAWNTSEFSQCIEIEAEPTPTPVDSPTLTPTPTATVGGTPTHPPGSRMGDTDCDGDADPVDILIVLLDTAGLPHSAACIAMGDTDCDGDRDATDSLGIMRFVAGLPAAPQHEPCPNIGEITSVASLLQG